MFIVCISWIVIGQDLRLRKRFVLARNMEIYVAVPSSMFQQLDFRHRFALRHKLNIRNIQVLVNPLKF